MGKHVKKKILPEYYNAVIRGDKTFELRKDEDDIQVGDVLCLMEWNPHTEEHTGRRASYPVKYVIRNVPEYGLMEGYCIIGF